MIIEDKLKKKNTNPTIYYHNFQRILSVISSRYTILKNQVSHCEHSTLKIGDKS